MNIEDNVVTKIYNKLFSDELDSITNCNHLEYVNYLEPKGSKLLKKFA